MTDLPAAIHAAIWDYSHTTGWPIAGDDIGAAEYIAAHVERNSDAAHLRPVVTTVAELAELPVGAVVRDHDGAIFERSPDGEGGNPWWYDGDPHEVSDIALDATVLYRPAEGA